MKCNASDDADRIVARPAGKTAISYSGDVVVHTPSTAKLDVRAVWTEWHDDSSSNTKPTTRTKDLTAFELIISNPPESATFEGMPFDHERFRIESAVHEFGDTKARRVLYHATATSRFPEYFKEYWHVASKTGSEAQREASRQPEWPRFQLDSAAAVSTIVLSTAPPPPPTVRGCEPVFAWTRWERDGNVFHRTRESGWIRLVLDREWYKSGVNEQVALVLNPNPEGADELPEGKYRRASRYMSRWGGDPLWRDTEAQRANPTHSSKYPGYATPWVSAKDVLPLATPVTALMEVPPPPGSQKTEKVCVSVLPLGEPQYDAVLDAWVCEFRIDPRLQYMPFVKLGIARYQPHGLVVLSGDKVGNCQSPIPCSEDDVTLDCRVSQPTLIPQLLQLFPERRATIRIDNWQYQRIDVRVEGNGARSETLAGMVQLARMYAEVQMPRQGIGDPSDELDWADPVGDAVEVPDTGCGEATSDRMRFILRRVGDSWVGCIDVKKMPDRPLRIRLREVELFYAMEELNRDDPASVPVSTQRDQERTVYVETHIIRI